jgi:cytidylate kinase
MCCNKPSNFRTVSEQLIITIDGPAGTGKSTVAARLAKKLGVARLDTGAMYRTVALIAFREGIDPTDGDALVQAIAAHTLHYDLSTDPPEMQLDGESVEPYIRNAEIGAIVSEVSVPASVRAIMGRMQREAAALCPRLVSEGRDQGSVVFPEAALRFYLTAEVEQRVRRRLRQLRAMGRPADAEAVANEIAHRDHVDASRTAAPLVCPEGAIRIDSTNIDTDAVVEVMLGHVRELAHGT